MQQQLSDSRQLENELDIRGLFRSLWAGKFWIVGTALLFALLTLIYTFFAPQEWSATAITDRPTMNMLGGFYSQQQFLHNLESKNNPLPVAQPSIVDDAYKEFIVQLSAWDTRRDFWLQTDYYRQRKVGNSKADAALLNKLVDQIQYTPADNNHNPHDKVKLIVETAQDANTLLRQYVAFASQRATSYLNSELKGAWQVRIYQLKAQVNRQDSVAQAIYQRRLNSVKQALQVAKQNNIDRITTDVPPGELPDSELFMLGRPMLQARLENLQASGPDFEISYDQNKALLTTLENGPSLSARFQTYRYLRTPEEPVKRDSPRRNFLLVMWGAVGVLAGAGIALLYRRG